ncbi:MAG: hypothetical protein J0M24_14840 [Verrucomicrobia bacterium]|nr:hypothetical protein [Verrucomicrobiota bacterium]
MKLRSILLRLWIAVAVTPIHLCFAQSPQHSNDVALVTRVLEVALRKPTPQANLAFIRQTVEKDERRFQKLLRENVPSDPKDAEELRNVRVAKLGFLTNGIRWSLIEEIAGEGSVILGIENLDTVAASQVFPTQAAPRILDQTTRTKSLYPFEQRWLYDAKERFGYRVADYFRGPNGSVTSSGANAPILPTPKLNRFDGLEPELVVLFLNALKASLPGVARQPNSGAHPDWIDFSEVKVSPHLITNALAAKAIMVVSANELSVLTVDLGNALTLKLEFSEKGPLHFPRAEITMKDQRLRLVTRELTPDQPWRGFWQDETVPAFGSAASQTTRYLLETRAVEMDREVGAFNAQYVRGGESITEVLPGGAAVSLIKTTNGFRPVAFDLPASWAGLGGKALATIAVIGGILALLVFVPRGQKS